jgi:chaperone modulatory protein CbpM
MTSIEMVITSHAGLRRDDLERWISNQWVRPDSQSGRYVFREIDIARVSLILELRNELAIDEDALPVVLSLMDQVYDLRRRLRRLGDAITTIAPEDMRRELADFLADPSP